MKLGDPPRCFLGHHAVYQARENRRESTNHVAERSCTFCFICVPGKPAELSLLIDILELLFEEVPAKQNLVEYEPKHIALDKGAVRQLPCSVFHHLWGTVL